MPLPRFTRRAAYRLDSTGSALIGSPESVEVTERRGETYLRLYGLDLGPEAILDFANTHGVFFDVGWIHQRLRRSGLFRAPYPVEHELEEIRSVYSTDAGLTASLADEDGRFVGTLDAFRHAARCIRDLTTAWRMANGDIDADPSALEALQGPLGARGHPYLNVKNVLIQGLSELLTGFRPFLGSGPADPAPEPEFDLPSWNYDDGPEARDITIQIVGPPSSGVRVEARATPLVDGLAEICALELFNHIVGGEVYRRCQNENCGRLFVRQYGRAEHGMSKRKGVMYCSASCARATAQRRYRREKAARKHQP